ncbi:hypothetical protein CPT_MarsHill_106 [Staphylococcus phage MarsHill]|nr:hypothetical protein CPT_MarsHill_106 [Staphylococcus phage MarsHill]
MEESYLDKRFDSEYFKIKTRDMINTARFTKEPNFDLIINNRKEEKFLYTKNDSIRNLFIESFILYLKNNITDVYTFSISSSDIKLIFSLRYNHTNNDTKFLIYIIENDKFNYEKDVSELEKILNDISSLVNKEYYISKGSFIIDYLDIEKIDKILYYINKLDDLYILLDNSEKEGKSYLSYNSFLKELYLKRNLYSKSITKKEYTDNLVKENFK